ncbi:unnamed protein product [Cyprideis torosa]|uniref:Uncharacterized protein n=1 Tax=Cyprideis torosa TaxID=163714 RepID=A0A7R8ZPF6_9CRUS|nr:unnamed protein product [Cyprideis torosa]CAG0898760.1 unnamed protein product [Cyprideis torosa]
MGGMKFSKIIAAFVIAGAVAILSGIIATKASAPRVLEEDAYPIEALEPASGESVAEATVEATTEVVEQAGEKATEAVEEVVEAAPVKKADGAEPILAMLADADIARGQKVAKACAACHTFDQGGKNGVGPNLWNVVGRKKQSIDGFKYSGFPAVARVVNSAFVMPV